MISYVKGILAEKAKDRIVVESGMMGIGIFVPMSVLEVLPPLGEEVKIYTHLQVREDDMSLYGFLSRSDLEMFRQLLAALLRAGNHDPFSCQRLFFSPCTRISKRTDLPDHKDGRRLDALTHTLFWKCLQGCADHSLGRKGSVHQKCRRRLRFHSRIQKPLTDPRRIRNTHQKN